MPAAMMLHRPLSGDIQQNYQPYLHALSNGLTYLINRITAQPISLDGLGRRLTCPEPLPVFSSAPAFACGTARSLW
jgi:hypothetical protein